LITCRICHKPFKRLTCSHILTHNISYLEYKSRFEQMQENKICTYKNDHTNWKCSCIVQQEGQSEYCILHEPTNQKDQAKFNEALESLISLQLNNQSTETVHLDGIHFPDDFSWSQKTFKKIISFANAVFYGKLKILDTVFEKDAIWGFCIFNNEVEFGRVEFSTVTRFFQSTFRNTFKFYNVTFHGVTFVNASFDDGGVFKHSNFYDFTSFRHIKTPKSSKIISFYFIHFISAERTWFEDVDLSKISFSECDLRYVKFINVEWVKPKWPATKRKCLRDEFVKNDGRKLALKDFERVRNEYQQLKLNYEEARSFADAGDFYYGEMECLRKSLGLKRFLPTLKTVYWASSGYGERPLRAGLNLFLLIALWIYCLMFWGLKPTFANSGYNSIDYEFSWNSNNFPVYVKDALNTLTYVIEILLREEKVDRIYSPIPRPNRWFSGDGINVIGFILVYLQVILFALAVRRRFRR